MLIYNDEISIWKRKHCCIIVMSYDYYFTHKYMIKMYNVEIARKAPIILTIQNYFKYHRRRPAGSYGELLVKNEHSLDFHQ